MLYNSNQKLIVLTPTVKGSRKMNKTIEVIPVKTAYSIKNKEKEIASIELSNGLSGLINTKNNQVIGKLDYYTEILHERVHYRNLFFLKKGSIMSIYDPIEEKFLIEDWILIKVLNGDYQLILLQSPLDGSYHLFDDGRKGQFIENIEHIETLYRGFGFTYYSITIHGKKGLYVYTRNIGKFISPIEYNDIKLVLDMNESIGAIIYTKGSKDYFAYLNTPEILSIPYDKITIDKNTNSFLYGKRGNVTDIYDLKERTLLTSIATEEIECLCSRGERQDDPIDGYFFKTKQEDKYGLCMVPRKDYVCSILEHKYDQMYKENNRITLEKEGQKGLYDCVYQCLIEANNDQIKPLKQNYIGLCRNGLWTIGQINYRHMKPIVEDCEILNSWDEDIFLFRKNGKMGLVYLENENAIVVEAAYDSITNITKEYYLVEQNQKKGILRLDSNHHQGVLVVPVECDEIEIEAHSELEKNKTLLLSLNKGEQKELMKLDLDPQSYKPLSTIHEGSIESIEYLPDIFIIKNQNYTYVYDYSGKLLELFPANTMIHWNGEDVKTKEHYYLVNDICYSYDTRRFEEIKALMLDAYVVRYETQDCTYQIMGYNEEEYNNICGVIDSLSDEKAEEYLYGLSKNGMPHEYPRLTLKRVEGKK